MHFLEERERERESIDNKMYKYEPSHAKRALIVKIIKIDIFTDYDKIQFKFTEYEIWDRYEA